MFLWVLIGGVKAIITMGGLKLTGEQKSIGAAFMPFFELVVVIRVKSLGESNLWDLLRGYFMIRFWVLKSK